MDKTEAENIIDAYVVVLARFGVRRESWLPCSKAKIRYAIFKSAEAHINKHGSLYGELGLRRAYEGLDSFVEDDLADKMLHLYDSQKYGSDLIKEFDRFVEECEKKAQKDIKHRIIKTSFIPANYQVYGGMYLLGFIIIAVVDYFAGIPLYSNTIECLITAAAILIFPMIFGMITVTAVMMPYYMLIFARDFLKDLWKSLEKFRSKENTD